MAKNQTWNLYSEEIKQLFDVEVKAFKITVAVPTTTSTLDTSASEHAIVLVLDVSAHPRKLSLLSFDDLDWWINVVQAYNGIGKRMFLSLRYTIYIHWPN